MWLQRVSGSQGRLGIFRRRNSRDENLPGHCFDVGPIGQGDRAERVIDRNREPEVDACAAQFGDGRTTAAAIGSPVGGAAIRTGATLHHCRVAVSHWYEQRQHVR